MLHYIDENPPILNSGVAPQDDDTSTRATVAIRPVTRRRTGARSAVLLLSNLAVAGCFVPSPALPRQRVSIRPRVSRFSSRAAGRFLAVSTEVEVEVPVTSPETELGGTEMGEELASVMDTEATQETVQYDVNDFLTNVCYPENTSEHRAATESSDESSTCTPTNTPEKDSHSFFYDLISHCCQSK